MKVLFAAPVVLVVSVMSINAFAQSQGGPSSQGEPPSRLAFPQKRIEHLTESLLDRSRPRFKREDRVVKKGLLAPSPSDRLAFAEFLQLPNTGLIRLLPREVYDSKTYRTEKKLDVPGGGAYYSFADLTHAYGYGSDIELDHNSLMVGFAGADYGMLTNLGDVPIETITLDDPRVQFLSTYKPPASESLARAEFRRFNHTNGPTVDGLRYQRRVPVSENTTYLLRSIVYDRTDVLVALRLARKDTDGSVIIAWKLLKNYPRSKLARN